MSCKIVAKCQLAFAFSCVDNVVSSSHIFIDLSMFKRGPYFINKIRKCCQMPVTCSHVLRGRQHLRITKSVIFVLVWQYHTALISQCSMFIIPSAVFVKIVRTVHLSTIDEFITKCKRPSLQFYCVTCDQSQNAFAVCM